MPKPKRYENLQNSVYSASTSQGVVQSSSTESQTSHFDDTPYLHQQRLTSFLQPTPRLAPSVQAAPHPTPSVQTTLQPIPSIQTASHLKPSKKPSGRESMSHWMVDAIDSQGAIKKLKVKKKDVFNLSNGERIMVDFDDLDSPIGEGQGILAGFYGILAKDSSIFPIHFEKWSSIPATYFNRCFDQFIQEKIELAMTQSTTDESEVSPNDAIGKVLGKEHPGRVRCLGLGVVPSRAFKQTRPRFSDLNASRYNNNGSCSFQCQEKYNQILNAHSKSQDNYNVMMNAHTQMMSAFKTYMIMKEGRIPEEFVEIFDSTTSSTRES